MSMNIKRHAVLPFLFAALVLAGCSRLEVESPTSTTMPPVNPAVKIEQSRFAPLTLTVATGTVVSFENTDPFAHTVTDRDGVFDSGRLEESDTFELEFSEVGTFAYFCEIHPTMRAQVTVTP